MRSSLPPLSPPLAGKAEAAVVAAAMQNDDAAHEDEHVALNVDDNARLLKMPKMMKKTIDEQRHYVLDDDANAMNGAEDEDYGDDDWQLLLIDVRDKIPVNFDFLYSIDEQDHHLRLQQHHHLARTTSSRGQPCRRLFNSLTVSVVKRSSSMQSSKPKLLEVEY
ncbi:hypothetical protein FF38_04950 [Lucilia cuprina]|uniref:Uncharacterized protein n=1 Tax=Lucilia cuprina TaxID=7375 RepID=A0A0L0CEX2_LUCCU|nr:hypothetical protein FF38_04950 [Lucilia cuprina]